MEMKNFEIERNFDVIQKYWDNLGEDIPVKFDMNPKFINRIRFPFRYILLVWKILLFSGYVYFAINVFPLWKECFLTLYFIPYIIVCAIIIINLWWYMKYIGRILTTNKYYDTVSDFNDKKKILLTMERIEWIGAFTLYPVFILTWSPLIYYVKYKYSFYNNLGLELTNLLPRIIIVAIIGVIVWSINIQTIKNMKPEIYKIKILNIFNLWKS